MDEINIRLPHDQLIALEALLEAHTERPWVLEQRYSGKLYEAAQKTLKESRDRYYNPIDPPI